MNQALTFGLLGGGGILLTKALTGNSWAQIAKGHAGTVSTTGTTLAGGGVAAVGSALTGAAAAASSPAPVAPGQHGLVSTALLASIGAKHGWTPAQIADWMRVVKQESNGTLTDTNSSSGAYGIAQFINGPSEYATYGGNSTTVTGQLTAMANYIAQRYGNPSAAWAHEQSHNWY